MLRDHERRPRVDRIGTHDARDRRAGQLPELTRRCPTVDDDLTRVGAVVSLRACVLRSSSDTSTLPTRPPPEHAGPTIVCGPSHQSELARTGRTRGTAIGTVATARAAATTAAADTLVVPWSQDRRRRRGRCRVRHGTCRATCCARHRTRQRLNGAWPADRPRASLRTTAVFRRWPPGSWRSQSPDGRDTCDARIRSASAGPVGSTSAPRDCDTRRPALAHHLDLEAGRSRPRPRCRRSRARSTCRQCGHSRPR